MTHYLRFPDEDTGIAALEAAGMYRAATEDEPGGPILATIDYALDVVGLIIDKPAALDEDGNVVTPATYLPGWHVNYIGEPPDAWAGYVINPAPTSPVRIFAGNE